MIVAITFIIIGLLVRFISILQLRESFSLNVEKPKRLHTKGFYRFSRNPMYLGTMLILLGLCLISDKAALMYLSFIFFLDRVLKEEKLLKDAFGNEYEMYKMKVKRFIPFLF